MVMRRGGSSTPDAAVVAMADSAAVIELDAAAATPDATVVVAQPVDAAPVTTADAPMIVADAPEDAAPPKDPIAAAFEERRFADVVAECTRVFRADQASACTLSACKTNQDARAQKWYGKITSATAKRTIASSCRELGVDVTPKVVRPPVRPDAGVDPCAANPMNCQR
jgi:hypothetical protein